MNTKECRDTRREIDELEFGAEPSQRVMSHLAVCGSCRQFRAERTKLRELVGSLAPVAAPADFDMRLRARLTAEKSSSRPQIFFARLFSTPALAAVALFVIVAGTVVWISQRQTITPIATPKSVATNKGTADGNRTQSNQDASVSSAPATAGSDALAQNDGNISGRRIRTSGRAIRSQDYASLPANSIRQSDADQAYVNAPSKPVVFSLEDERGTTRKISLPPITFGAQNLVDNRMQASYSGNSRVW